MLPKVTEQGIKVDKTGTLYVSKGNLMETLYQNYALKLTEGSTDKQTWLAKFIDKKFDEMKSKGDSLLSIKTVNNLVKETADYFNKRESFDREYTEFLLYKKLFPWQKKALESSSRRKCYICSRRTGKSYEESYEMVKHCLIGYDEILVDDRVVKKPRCAVYIGLTKQKAANIMWDNLKEIIEYTHIPVNRIDNSEYRIDFANGAYLALEGNSSKAERNKIRGSDWSMAIVDECQNQQSLAYLYDSILNPIIKPRNGVMIFSGTGPLTRGYWSNIIEGITPGWEIFHYTIYDNPTILNPEDILKEEAERLGGENNPVYKREWLGEICWDDNLLIYPKLHTYSSLPKDFKPVEFYGGVDYGFGDSNAILGFVVDENGMAYMVSEWGKPACDVTTLCNQMKAMVDSIKTRFPNIPEENYHIVADNNDQTISAEFFSRGITYIENAYKADKPLQIALLNEALASGHLLVPEGSEVQKESTMSSYKWDEEHQRIIFEEDKEVFHANFMDALRYAYFNYHNRHSLDDANK